MIRFLVKEASLLLAFVVLGGLLLISLWISTNVDKSILREFQNTQISLVLKDGSERGFRNFIEDNKNVLRYEVFSAAKNKDRLGSLYPDLKNVLNPLEEKFFPASAVVTVKDGDAFLAELKSHQDLYQSQILHKPPVEIQRFASVLTAIFACLWLMTLTLVLYFNLERITIVEEPRWSLMKMLGAKPLSLYTPLWVGQTVRIAIASAAAMALFYIVSKQIEDFFIWTWMGLPASSILSFLMASVGLTSLISFILFYSRYRKVAIG